MNMLSLIIVKLNAIIFQWKTSESNDMQKEKISKHLETAIVHS